MNRPQLLINSAIGTTQLRCERNVLFMPSYITTARARKRARCSTYNDPMRRVPYRRRGCDVKTDISPILEKPQDYRVVHLLRMRVFCSGLDVF